LICFFLCSFFSFILNTFSNTFCSIFFFSIFSLFFCIFLLFLFSFPFSLFIFFSFFVFFAIFAFFILIFCSFLFFYFLSLFYFVIEYFTYLVEWPTLPCFYYPHFSRLYRISTHRYRRQRKYSSMHYLKNILLFNIFENISNLPIFCGFTFYCLILSDEFGTLWTFCWSSLERSKINKKGLKLKFSTFNLTYCEVSRSGLEDSADLLRSSVGEIPFC